MKAVEASVLSFLQRSPQFIIPSYQRTYSSTEKQCRQLWDDTHEAKIDGPAERLEVITYVP